MQEMGKKACSSPGRNRLTVNVAAKAGSRLMTWGKMAEIIFKWEICHTQRERESYGREITVFADKGNSI